MPLIAALIGIFSGCAVPIWYEIYQEFPGWLITIFGVSVGVVLFYKAAEK